MTTFEQTLVAELHAEADRVSATTDTPAMRLELRRRLDAKRGEQARRRWTYGLAALAAAVAAVVAISIGLAWPPAEPPATGPSPSQSTGPALKVSTSTMTPNLTVDLPYWTAFTSPGSWVNGLIWYSQSAEGCQQGCADDDDRTFMMVQPRTIALPGAVKTGTAPPTAQQMVDAWVAVQDTGYGVVLDSPATTTVGGKPATALTVRVDKAVVGPVGCENDMLESCIRVPEGRVVRVVVVDTGDPLPTAFYLMSNAGSGTSGSVADDLDAVVGTVSWG